MLLSAFIFLVIIWLNIWIYKLDVPESENLRKKENYNFITSQHRLPVWNTYYLPYFRNEII